MQLQQPTSDQSPRTILPPSIRWITQIHTALIMTVKNLLAVNIQVKKYNIAILSSFNMLLPSKWQTLTPAPCVAQYWVRFFKNESTICSWPQNVGLKKSNIACPFIIQVRSSLFIWHKSQAELSEAKQERTISAHICCTQANVLGPHSRSVWFRARLILCLFDSQGHKKRIKGTKNLKYFYFLSSLIIYLKSGKERQLFVWAAHNLWPH